MAGEELEEAASYLLLGPMPLPLGGRRHQLLLTWLEAGTQSLVPWALASVVALVRCVNLDH